MRSADVLSTALKLVSGDRQKTHGDKLQNHENIARLWSAYLRNRSNPEQDISALDVALMMALLKISRTQLGDQNSDDYVDLVGYGAIAGEIASAR